MNRISYSLIIGMINSRELRLLAFIFFLITPIALSEGVWETIHHVPGSDWEDVFFLDELHGWAVAKNGGIISTNDGGKNWNLLRRDRSRYYWACFFVSEQKGWISGGASLFFTDDGGKTLDKQAGIPDGIYLDIYFVSENEGWIVGYQGNAAVIFHTTDGGKHWEVQEAGFSGYLRKVFFINGKKGFAMGIITKDMSGVMLRTDDGGKKWIKQSIPVKSAIVYDVFFLNQLEGWISLGNLMFKTTDGGNTWQEIKLPQNAWVGSLYFANSNEGFFIGSEGSAFNYSGLVMWTNDGCRSFEKKSGFSMLRAMASSSNKCWIVGHDNTIIHNQGVNDWQLQLERAYDFQDIDYVGKDKSFIVGLTASYWSPSGELTVFSTNDGWKTWEEMARVQADSCCLDFADDSTGWIGSEKGIYKTIDGGRTLQKDEAISDMVSDVVFPTRNVGWILGHGAIWRTWDGGGTWERNTIDRTLMDIYVIGEKAWLAGGLNDKGFIYVTDDGGKSFEKDKLENFLNAIFFINEEMGWAVGVKGSIFFTQNGGRSWQKQKSGTDEYLTDVLFLSEKEGWVVGGSWGSPGIILHTRDSGDSWVIEDFQPQEKLNKIVYPGGDHLLVIGECSTILRYTDESLAQYSKQVAVSDVKSKPTTWGRIKNHLYQNYPNPFNPDTWIPYELGEAGQVSITVYDSTGQIVRELDIGRKEAGYYISKNKAAYWDGRDSKGERVASGLYFYQLTAGEFSAIRKMLLIY